MGEIRERLMRARAARIEAQANHLRAERVWLDDPACDADDYAHPARVALEDADKVLRERAESCDQVEDDLRVSGERRTYTMRLVATDTEHAKVAFVRHMCLDLFSLQEARAHALQWARDRAGTYLIAVLIEGEDGTRDLVESRARDW